VTAALPTMSSITKEFTRELRDLSTAGAAGLIQNFQSLLKEGDLSSSTNKYSKEDIARICTLVFQSYILLTLYNNKLLHPLGF
jgi:hypothetical protein